MKSSFSRKSGTPAADLGTRPGPFGQTLASSGHADVDRLLGGGVPLGTLLLILEDGWSQHHATLLRYFLAEGAACGQSLMLLSNQAPVGGLEALLPGEVGGRAAEREPAGGGALRIAWQYQSYLAAPRQEAASQRDWCHQFDLTKPAGAGALRSSRAECRACGGGGDAAAELAGAAAEFVHSLAPQHHPTQPPQQPVALGPANVGRLAVLSLGGPGWGGAGGAPASSRAVLRALLVIKAAVRDSRCAAVVTVPAGLHSASDRARMQHVADAVVALERVRDDSQVVRLAPDSASVAGLLHLRKLPSLGAVCAPLPPVALHLVRHKRKRLAITPVEVDPDAEAAAAAGGGGTSAAAALCGGPVGSKTALEF